MTSSMVVYGDDLSGGVEKQPSGTPGAPLSVSVVDGTLPSGELFYSAIGETTATGDFYFDVPVGLSILVRSVRLNASTGAGGVISPLPVDEINPSFAQLVVGERQISSLEVLGMIGFVPVGEPPVFGFGGGEIGIGTRIDNYNAAVAGSRVGLTGFDGGDTISAVMCYSVIS